MVRLGTIKQRQGPRSALARPVGGALKKTARQDAAWASGLFAALAALYWHGRSRSFGAGDSPQHVLSALTWGVSWPPGYPLYNTAAHFFARLPLGTPESCVNGFSGLCHAAAAAIFFLILRRQGLKAVWSAVAAALMALSPLYWYYSEVAEVRALNDLLAASAILLALVWIEKRSLSSLLAFGVVLGLGISHHPTYVLGLPALLFLAASERAWPKAGPAAAFTATVLIACASPYVVLGLHLHASPPVYNPMGVETWRDVLDLFLRKNLGGPMRMVGGKGVLDFGAFQWAPLAAQFCWLAGAFFSEPGPAGAVLAGAGAVFLALRRRQLGAFWALWLGVNLACVLFLSSQQLHPHDPDYARAIALRFFLMPFLSLFACVGFGLEWLAESSRAAAFGAGAAILLMSAAHPVDLRGHDPLLRYGEDVLASSAPGDIVLLASDDAVLAMNYLDYVAHRCEGRVFLNPVLFTFKPYLRDLRRRYPDLNLPPVTSDGLSMDWRQWQRLNPKRRLFAEAMFLEVVRRDFKGVYPHGVLAAAAERAPDRRALSEEADAFLKERSLGRLSARDVYPWTQEVYLAKTSGLLLNWYGSSVDGPGNEGLVSEIRVRLTALE